METIYTRLRNEILHPRNNFDPVRTKNEIINLLPQFRENVKNIIILNM
jgi:hypothetical protein